MERGAWSMGQIRRWSGHSGLNQGLSVAQRGRMCISEVELTYALALSCRDATSGRNISAMM